MAEPWWSDPPDDDRPWPEDDLVSQVLRVSKPMADGEGTPSMPAPQSPSLVERAKAIRGRCPAQRIPTGLPTLDEACRGGFVLPRFIVVGGAPGAGKTSLVVWWALQWAKTGRPVVMLAVDEGADDIVMRLAAEQGLDVAKLEDGDGEEWAALEDYLATLGITVLDGDEGWTVESAASEAAGKTNGLSAVLIVDSLQTANCMVDRPDASPRERITAVTGVCKRAVKNHRLLVVATSELARAAYRNRQQAENIDPLAAFAESRGVEYGAQTALVLRSLPDGDGLVEVCVPKNRGGRKPTLNIQIDSRTRITEVERDTDDASLEAQYEALRREVLDAIRRGGMASANAVYARVGKRRQDVLSLVKEELEAGRVVRVDGQLRIQA